MLDIFLKLKDITIVVPITGWQTYLMRDGVFYFSGFPRGASYYFPSLDYLSAPWI